MQKRRLSHLIFSIGLAAGLTAWLAYASGSLPAGATTTAFTTYQATEGTGAAIVRPGASDETGLRFVLETPAAVTRGGRAEVPGLEHRLQTPGAPALPYFATFIALPPEAHATVQVREQAMAKNVVGHLAPVLRPEPGAEGTAGQKSSPDDALLGEDVRLAPPPLFAQPDPLIYARNMAYPESPYSLSKPMYYRDLRLVELRLYPLRYNPVNGTLIQARQLDVAITFGGGQTSGVRAAPSVDDAYVQGFSGQVLNFEQAKMWRALPQALLASAPASLPLGIESYKITLNHDGIYEISGADLAAAGMAISLVDPGGLEMMVRGAPVAYQFIGDGDNQLEANERIRFYGWAFAGSRAEKQFIGDNVYWLWAGGAPTTIVTQTNQAGLGYPATTAFMASETREPENHFFASWTLWDGFPNEADAWFWDYIRKGVAALTRTYTITLPHPASSGPDATYLAEFSSRTDLVPPSPPHLVHGYFNGHPTGGSVSWYGRANVNLSNTVPITRLTGGSNSVKLVYATTTVDQLYLNRITVDYLRRLVADGDQLIFSDDAGGGKEFQVGGFSQGVASQVLAWDVTDPSHPVQIAMSGSQIISGGGTFTYTVGITRPTAGSRLIVTTLANVMTAGKISRYSAASLDPPGGEVDWLAISHRDFMTEARRLADHRADPAYGGLITHVVDIEDIINQYGHGLPLPAAIHDYLAYGLGHWSRAPSYVVLMGDATQNPRQLDCPLSPQGGCFAWDKDEPTYVLTDLVFEDRFQGLIPSDHTFVLLSGNDVLPDMAIGRIPVQTAAEAAGVVDKIITFEQNQFTPEAWQQKIMFVADNADSGGNFCSANQATGALLPGSLDQLHLCLDPAGPISTTSVLTPLMAAEINGSGISVLNYRGHGAIETWASEKILTSATTGFWANAGKPVLILSADCLDGHFAWPGAQGLGETFLELAGRGSVAHWSSSGLGYTSEHSVLHQGFYEAVFDAGLTAIGDAVNYAKVKYSNGGFHESELYSFVLEGDPAMRLFRPDVSLAKHALQAEVQPGQQVQFELTVGNDGIYPAQVTVTDTLPASLSYVSASATGPFSVNPAGNSVAIELLSPVPWGQVETITLTAVVSPSFLGLVTNQALATNSGANLSGGVNLFASAIVTVTDEPIGGLVAANDSPTPLGSVTTLSATVTSGANTSYSWSFGDGVSGTGAVATHIYTAAGTYTATVTASNSTNSVNATTQVLVEQPHRVYLPVISKP
jgi:uncharacterized repeat protein (TIGR01451 family)